MDQRLGGHDFIHTITLKRPRSSLWVSVKVGVYVDGLLFNSN